MGEQKIDTLDSMLEQLTDTFEVNQSAPINDRQAITIWLPEKYKAKYELLQKRSNRKFGKLIREFVKKSIDKVSVEPL